MLLLTMTICLAVVLTPVLTSALLQNSSPNIKSSCNTRTTPQFKVNGKPYQFQPDSNFNADDFLHYTSAEAHQHPWLATLISITILMVMIFGIISCANSEF